jgi:hypothetical protein
MKKYYLKKDVETVLEGMLKIDFEKAKEMGEAQGATQEQTAAYFEGYRTAAYTIQKCLAPLVKELGI